jgi:hypothetical protein
MFYLTMPIIIGLLVYISKVPEYFDVAYIGLLMLSCIFCWSNKDVLSGLIILLMYWLMTLFIYYTGDGLYTMLIVYSGCILISLKTLNQLLGKAFFILTIYGIAAEILWWKIGYENKPMMYYPFSLLGLTVITREALLNKVFLLSKFFNHHSAEVDIDYQIGKVLYLASILCYLNIMEFYLRHLAEMPNATNLYYQFTNLANISSFSIIVIVYMNYFNNESKKHMKA